MAKLKPDEIMGLSKAFAEMNNYSEKTQQNLEAMLATQDKGIKKLERGLKKIQVANIQNRRNDLKILDKYLSKKKELNEEEEKEFKLVKERLKEQDRLSKSLIKLTENISDQTKAGKNQNGLFSAQIAKIKQYASVLGILSLAWTGLKKIYANWAELQTKITLGMGQAAQALGGTARQMEGFQRRASDMRDTFSHLEGDVDGWAMSMQNLQETSLALRRNMDALGSGIEGAMLRTARGFGIGTENAGQLFRLLETGVAGSTMSLDEFGADMLHFSENIGSNASQMVSDFVDARASVAQFGDEGVETFRNAAMMANEFGFETRRIFDMMRGFDTFSQASQNVNQLNAILGTTMSSYEIMLEQDPARRLEIIRDELSATGQTWGTMSRQARQALSQVTGESEDILARVFGSGRSLEQVQAEEAQAENRRQARQNRQESAQDTMTQLLERTSIVWDNMGRIIERIVNIVSETLGPVFEELHLGVDGIADEFRNWLQAMVNSGQAETFIRGIAGWIREMFTMIRETNWAQVWDDAKATWAEWQPTVTTIAAAIMGILSFAAEHPGVVAALFAGVGIARFGALLARIPGVMALLGSGTVIGTALPLAGLVGGAAIAAAGEQARVAEGMRSTSDMATQRRLSSTGLEALRNRRGEGRQRAMSGNRQRGFAGAINESFETVTSIGSEYLGLRTTEGMRANGFRTGQEADQMRNGLPSVVNDIIRGSLGVPTDELARRIYGAYNDRALVDEVVGMRLADYIEQQRGNTGPVGGGGAIQSPTSATESASTTSRSATVSPPPASLSNNQEIVLYSRLEIDSQVLANTIQRRATR